MSEHSIVVEPATPAAIAPFGCFIGAEPTVPRFAEWPGVTVYGPSPITIGSGGEILHVQMRAMQFPARVRLLERHFHHTQTYLPANGRPFVMVLGSECAGDLPNVQKLRAFLFSDGAGIAMSAGTWHEFPLALQDDTRFTVILREESHINRVERPAFPNDASGPDLERWDIAARSTVWVRM